jgi:hypothetical protein
LSFSVAVLVVVWCIPFPAGGHVATTHFIQRGSVVVKLNGPSI